MNNAFDGATCGMQKITDAMQGVVSDLVTAAAKNITKAPGHCSSGIDGCYH